MFGVDDALLGALVIGGSMAASSAYSARSSKQQGVAMNKESWKYYQKQKALDYCYDKNKYLPLDKEYNEWYKQLEYDWSKRYAENSSKWQVEGLKAAGLNPLLAASNGNFASTYGNSSPVTAKRSSGGSAIGTSADMHGNLDMAGSAAHLVDAFKKTTVLDAEATSARASANVAASTQEANINSAKADAALKEQQLQTEKILQNQKLQETMESAERTKHQVLENEKLRMSGGFKSEFMHDISVGSSHVNTAVNNLMDCLTNSAEALAIDTKRAIKKLRSPVKHSAKDVEQSPSPVKKGLDDYNSHIRNNNGLLMLR